MRLLIVAPRPAPPQIGETQDADKKAEYRKI